MTTTRYTDEQQADAIALLVNEQLDQILTGDQPDGDLRVAAHGYLTLRAWLGVRMLDVRHWHPGYESVGYPIDRTGREVNELCQFIEHMASADHGGCDRCGRTVLAADKYREAPTGWRWRQVGQAFAAFWYTLTARRTWRIVHERSCHR